MALSQNSPGARFSDQSCGSREAVAGPIILRSRVGAYWPLLYDLERLALWIQARATESDALIEARKLKTADCVKAYIVVAVRLVRLLREVPCRCPTWEEDGHLSNCDRIGAMKWQEKMAMEYGIYFHTEPFGKDNIPYQIKEMKRYEVLEASPDDPDVVPFRSTG